MLLAVAFWVLAGNLNWGLFRMMRSFVWLAPGLVLANALFGSPPRIWGPFSWSGLLFGLLIAWRLGWAAWMAVVLIRTCPPRDLLESFRAVPGFLRIPTRAGAGGWHSISMTLFLTLEILPQFADIRIKDFRNLPMAIAARIKNVVLPTILPLPHDPKRTRLRTADAAILLPAAALLVFAALV